jgi:hypothetical protein
LISATFLTSLTCFATPGTSSHTSAEWAVVIRLMHCKAPPVLGSGPDVASEVQHDPGPEGAELDRQLPACSERLSRIARWYSTGQIASRNPPPSAPDARSPRCCLPGGARTRRRPWHQGISLAIPARRAAVRAGTTPDTAEKARAEPVDAPALAENGCPNSQQYVSNWASRFSDERRVDHDERR